MLPLQTEEVLSPRNSQRHVAVGLEYGCVVPLGASVRDTDTPRPKFCLEFDVVHGTPTPFVLSVGSYCRNWQAFPTKQKPTMQLGCILAAALSMRKYVMCPSFWRSALAVIMYVPHHDTT